MDYLNLRGLIRGTFRTQELFAHALGISPCALSNKLNGKSEWTASEIRIACNVLGLTPDQIPQYFFCPKN